MEFHSKKNWSPFGILGILLPAVALFLLVAFPPHTLDLAVSKLFWRNGHWLGQGVAVAELVGHELIKVIPAGIALYYVWLAWRFGKAGDSLNRRRAVFVIVGLLLALFAVWWLKRTTGVYCPWSTVPFGGEQAMLNPTWHWSRVSGNCWPAGHSGTGFGLFVLYFAWRSVDVHKARKWLWVALLLGGFCSFLRITQGAHFLSHTLASLLIDWLIAALLYRFWLYPWEVRAKSPSPSAPNTLEQEAQQRYSHGGCRALTSD